ncbi:MAG: 1,4-dihydroxy-6-naphthoate synthase [Bacteroidota bacterium]
MNELTIGFSPCPNDCFIFDAMINGKIDTEGLSFSASISDVEDLNRKAFRTELDITKISYHAYAYIYNDYVLLHSGSALGNNCGPLLISKKDYGSQMPDITHFRIAIPGKYTTANLLLGLFNHNASDKTEMIFSNIENALLNDEVDAGVIIHENRFTYQQKGLHKIIDLGEHWETTAHSPIPLGGICVKRSMDLELKQTINRVLRRSIEFAFANPDSGMDFIRAHAQEMEEEVMRKHIELYVNAFSIDLGEVGINAVRTLFDRATKAAIIPAMDLEIFIEKENLNTTIS